MMTSKHARFMLPLLILAAMMVVMPALPAFSQSTPTSEISTADADAGLTIFAERCANCHGPQGAGDGDMVDRLPAPPRPFNDPEYARQAIPAGMFQAITDGNLEKGMPPFGPSSTNAIAEADRWNLVAAVFALSASPDAIARGADLFAALDPGPDTAFITDPTFWRDNSNQTAFDRLQALLPNTPADDVWAMVDYGRATFSFNGVAPVVLVDGVITGQVLNGTTGNAAGDLPALLRAFNPADFTIGLVLTSTVNTDGSFQFDITQAPSDWVYMASVAYNDISFSSDIGRLGADEPSAALPITIYDPTTDASVISIDQLHIIMNVTATQLEVNELYTFSNNANQVYVGDSGDVNGGTVLIPLPPDAQNPAFQRGFGSLDSFVPANELFPTDAGWRDTLPLRPGPNSMNLLVRYTLPYDSGMTVAHSVPYDTTIPTIILPDSGVTLVGDWQSSGPQDFQGQTFVQYTGAPVNAGGSLSITLEGKPRSGGGAVAINSTTQILIGAGALVLVAGIAIIATQRARRNAPIEEPADREELLATLVALDDAYANGKISAADYQQERQQVKEELMAIWNSSDS
ncbi:MAG: c-type cytochrome [Anaerolineales bacterium]|nr:c-type cytochrome [Anaerolineales bacterium]